MTQTQTQSGLPTYNPGQLLDTVASHMKVKSDRALGHKLFLPLAAINRIRQRELPIDATMLVWLHELTGMRTVELRALMGDRRKKSRLNYIYSARELQPAPSEADRTLAAISPQVSTLDHDLHGASQSVAIERELAQLLSIVLDMNPNDIRLRRAATLMFSIQQRALGTQQYELDSIKA